MSEHWKSTPKYWCKHCSCYVRDTKLERQNHEATARHQGSLKRFLRELHRGHEQGERDKERAQREIARLDGVVGSTSSGPSAAGPRITQHAPAAPPSETQLKKQREQLAEMGIAIPSTFRPEMAMVGEWTVTNSRVMGAKDGTEEAKMEARASGIRKREETEEEKEEEDAVRSLFKKPRRWGRDSKAMPEDDDELDALLSGTILPKRSTSDDVKDRHSLDEVKAEVKNDTEVKGEAEDVKQEPDDSTQGLAIDVKAEEATSDAHPPVKTESSDAGPDTGPAPVVFKKRKPKGLRQK